MNQFHDKALLNVVSNRVLTTGEALTPDENALIETAFLAGGESMADYLTPQFAEYEMRAADAERRLKHAIISLTGIDAKCDRLEKKYQAEIKELESLIERLT